MTSFTYKYEIDLCNLSIIQLTKLYSDNALVLEALTFQVGGSHGNVCF